jgi:hypothetical protein
MPDGRCAAYSRCDLVLAFKCRQGCALPTASAQLVAYLFHGTQTSLLQGHFPRHTVDHRCASASPSACPEKVAAQIPQAVVSAFAPWREIDSEDLRSGSDRRDSGTRGSGIARQRKALRTFAGTKGKRTAPLTAEMLLRNVERNVLMHRSPFSLSRLPIAIDQFHTVLVRGDHD